MKRILHFGGVLLALGMLLASCNIGVGDGQVSGDSVRTTSNSTLNNTSNVDGIVLKVNKIDNSRTILPADWTDITASKLTYVLLAQKKDATGGYETKKTFSYSELTGGTATVNLDLIEWDLKLIGYITGSDHTTKPCLAKELKGVDLSTGIKTVTFDLKPVDPTTTSATGSVDVTIEWLTEQPKRLEFGIYNKGTSTDEIVEDEGRGAAFSGFREIKADASFAVDTTAHIMSWHQDDVPAGMYKFAAVFYNDATAGEVIGYYIDYLYVDGGNLSKATVPYGDKFNTIPDNPTWLAVETLFVPQELTDTDTTVSGEYYAKFHWNDISNNETGFELVIDDGATEEILNPETLTGSPLFSTTWYDETEAKEKPFDDPTSSTASIINTIDAGRTWVMLKLKTETLYTAKIRAINKYTPTYTAGDTATTAKFCEILNRNGDGQGRSYAPIVTEGTGTTAKKQFGMFTVNYDLVGGEVTKADGTKTDNEDVTNYVVGFNYHSQPQYLMTDNKSDYPHISKTASVFDHWEEATNRLDMIPAKKHNNLNLTAVWSGTEINVSVTFPSYADAQDVPISADRNDRNTIPFKYNKVDVSKNSITVNANKSLKNTEFELSAVGENGKIIAAKGEDAVTSTEYGTITVSSTDKAWTWKPTERTLPGLYCLQITGDYEDAGSGRTLTLSGNLYIKVEN